MATMLDQACPVLDTRESRFSWIPAFAGMTRSVRIDAIVAIADFEVKIYEWRHDSI